MSSSLIISVISITISFFTFIFNLYRSLPHLEIEQLDEKYSGTILKQSDYLPDSDSSEECQKNGDYTSCILIDLMMSNNSSEPITIKSFSSKKTLSMDSISNVYGVQAGIGEIKRPKMIKKSVIFKGSELFELPLNIAPYSAIQKRVQLFITDDYAKEIMKNDNVKLKVKVNTSRHIFMNKKHYNVNVKLKSFDKLARYDNKFSNKEDFFIKSNLVAFKSGDARMISKAFISDSWLHDDKHN